MSLKKDLIKFTPRTEQQDALDFISMIITEVEVTEEPNFDPNNNYEYTIVNCILKQRPGFSKTDGYDVRLELLENGTQDMIFTGPGFEKPLVINNSSLMALNEAGISIVTSTPDLTKEMTKLLTETGIFHMEDIGPNGELKANAKIKEQFILKNPDGSFDYEVIDIGNGKGRNILKYDMDKITKTANPFVNAEVSGLLSIEQEAVAAWNVYLSQGKYWSYTEDLPLSQEKRDLFKEKYNDYFMDNYLKKFTENQVPMNPEDASIFDLQEAKKAKAQKFLQDNELI